MMWLVRVLSPCVKYVDVILPLALPGLLTYGVPEDDAARVGAGMRVVVPLRGKRLHTAVVRRVHSERPEHSHGGLSHIIGQRSTDFRDHAPFLGLGVGPLLLWAGRSRFGGPAFGHAAGQ